MGQSKDMFAASEELDRQRRRMGRRTFLWMGLAGTGAYGFYRWQQGLPRRLVPRETRYLTPLARFYSVSINPGFRPDAPPASWKLQFSGGEGSNFELSLREVRELERRQVYKTFMCISNPVGGAALGNARWTATPLAPLIRRLSGASGPGVSVRFLAQDGFDSSVPLEVALDPLAFLAYEMDGAPLPLKHGFPVRVLLAGKYGMKQPRWLQRIELSDNDSGYWERRGWSHLCDVKMTSRIDSVTSDRKGSWLVTGIAFCGATPVGAVHFSPDDGKSWREAKLSSPARPDSWATWAVNWEGPQPGRHVLVCRVSDARGRRQIESYTSSFPSGSTGLHRVAINL